MLRVRALGAVVVLVALLAACGSGAPATYVPASISCTAQMRPTTGSATGEETVSFTLTPVDALGGPAASVDVGPFGIDATFVGEAPEGHTVRIEVTSEGEPLAADLFQYGGTDALATDFTGGHGFTGLRYLYAGEAELQYSCDATG